MISKIVLPYLVFSQAHTTGRPTYAYLTLVVLPECPGLCTNASSSVVLEHGKNNTLSFQT